MDKRFNRSVTGKVVSTTRLRNTPMGNPVYSVELDTGDSYKLGDNASLCYAITNPEFEIEAHEFGLTANGAFNGYDRKAS